MNYSIERFYPNKVSEDFWDSYFDYDEKIFGEFNNGEPFPSRTQEKNFMKKPHPHYNIYRWLILSETEPRKIIGNGHIWHQNEQAPDYENIKEKLYFRINVLKEFRRKGIATGMLKVFIKEAKQIEKTILRAEVRNDLAVGFCSNFQGEIVAKRGTNRLYFKDINWDLMNQWRLEGKEKAFDISLEFFKNVPDEIIEEYCKLYTIVFNDAPAEDIAGEVIITPEKRRIDEKLYSENKLEWVTLISRERDGTISGLTEIFHNLEYKIEIEQELTGVLQPFRGRGLGKWLKAEMLFYIKDNYPTTKFIQTGNNDKNVPIMSINQRMGFKRHKDETFFEFSVKKLAQMFETVDYFDVENSSKYNG